VAGAYVVARGDAGVGRAAAGGSPSLLVARRVAAGAHLEARRRAGRWEGPYVVVRSEEGSARLGGLFRSAGAAVGSWSVVGLAGQSVGSWSVVGLAGQSVGSWSVVGLAGDAVGSGHAALVVGEAGDAVGTGLVAGARRAGEAVGPGHAALVVGEARQAVGAFEALVVLGHVVGEGLVRVVVVAAVPALVVVSRWGAGRAAVVVSWAPVVTRACAVAHAEQVGLALAVAVVAGVVGVG
jgi:hypothetical protein